MRQTTWQITTVQYRTDYPSKARKKEIQCDQIWWLIIAHIVKLITSASTYQCSFACVDHWGLHASPATSYFPPIRFNHQKTKIPALQESDKFRLGSKSSILVICQGQKLWHQTSIIPERNYKWFREGSALHLFLIFTRVEIKINGLISDRCRFFFSAIK